ncbi:hypothetical protein [Peribacillus frigoritolerans]|uniref:hypothetical protein n=1 Tax=Peribacillus frigoritolerans TaxID=450367 RepID=UPI0022813F22|nr:hypothetical protein [Peribacillus frigoritolerans]MCY8935666.1 hypothetical protein [Peribacillus frigoritolerans]
MNAIYKPSQQKEAWLGFDQAWTNEEISEDDFYDIIKKKSKTSRFLAYIMQFKIVEKQKHYKKIARTFTVPSHYKDGDLYYRSPLKTEVSKKGTTSQHDILFNIKSKFNFMEVYYACPMLFSQSDLFRPEFMKDEKKFREHLMEQLVLVDVVSAPRHLIGNIMAITTLFGKTIVEVIYIGVASQRKERKLPIRNG